MSKYLLAASALALFAGPASALTAPELWADWQETLQGFGSTLSAESETYSDGRLVLSGVTQRTEMLETVTESVFGEVTLIEQSDGSVRIEVPAVVNQVSRVEVQGETIENTVRVTFEGQDAVVRDEGAERIYDIAYSALTYAFEDMPGDSGSEEATVTATLSGYDSTTRLTEDAYDGTASLGQLALSIENTGAEPFTMRYEAAGVDVEVSGTIPDLPEGADLSNFADLNLSYDFTMAHGGSSFAVNGQTPEGPLVVDSTAGGGSLSATLSPTEMAYGFTSTDVSMTVTPPALPLPIALSAAENAVRMQIPLAEGETGPFALDLTLRDLTVDESLWGLFDPTGQLPRDPATLDVRASGEATVLASLMNPDAMETLAGPPFLPTSLDLNTLLLRVAGAELRGEGAVEWASIMSNPMPTGSVTLELDGGFGLLDKLVALGFVPPAQVAIIRGMAGAVAQPVGDDQLRSELEFTETGILANGLPLPF